MPDAPCLIPHVLSRLPGSARREIKNDISRSSGRATVDRDGYLPDAMSRSLIRNYFHWRSAANRYVFLMRGGDRFAFPPLRAPLGARLLPLVSRESRIPIHVLRGSGHRFPAGSPVSKARILFALLNHWLDHRLSKTCLGLPLGLSSSFGGRALTEGRRLLATDPEFKTRFDKLLLAAGDIGMSNLPSCGAP